MKRPRVTEILNPFSDFSAVPPDVLLAAGERGTAVHEACAAYALGLFKPIDGDLAGYFQSFKSWFNSYISISNFPYRFSKILSSYFSYFIN